MTLLPKTQLDAKLMLKSLQMTIDFEAGLNRRFASAQVARPDEQNSNSPVLQVPATFTGAISTAFEPYLRLFVEEEDKWVKADESMRHHVRTLSGMMEQFKQSVAVSDDDTGVFTSSTDLFIFYRQTLVSMAKLSTRKPFLDLSKLFGKYLLIFSDMLSSRLPKYFIPLFLQILNLQGRSTSCDCR